MRRFTLTFSILLLSIAGLFGVTGSAMAQPQPTGPTLVSGNVFNVDGRGTNANRYGTFEVMSDASNRFGVVLRIRPGGQSWIDATVDDPPEGGTLAMSWTMYSYDANGSRGVYAGKLVFDLQNRTSSTLTGNIRTTLAARGSRWVPQETGWAAIRLSSPAIGSFVDAIATPGAPTDSRVRGNMYILNASGGVASRYASFAVLNSRSSNMGIFLRFGPASGGQMDATIDTIDESVARLNWTLTENGRPKRAGTLVLDIAGGTDDQVNGTLQTTHVRHGERWVAQPGGAARVRLVRE